MEIVGARVGFNALGVQDINGQDVGITRKEKITTKGGMIMHTRGGERLGNDIYEPRYPTHPVTHEFEHSMLGKVLAEVHIVVDGVLYSFNPLEKGRIVCG